MKIFDRYPNFTLLPPDFKLARVEETFTYTSDNGETVTVKKGFITDGASIPKIAWSLIGGPFGEYAYAAFVHDFSYCYKLFSRKVCDKIFKNAMKDLNVEWFKRNVMYWAVRMFGWIGWNKHKKEKKKTTMNREEV